MVKIRIFKVMPRDGYVKKREDFGTRAKQNAKTGELNGRKVVKGDGDGTGVLRVQKPFILVKHSKNRRGTIRKRYDSGEIVGRY